MRYDDAVAFLQGLQKPWVSLAIRKDLSLEPELFGRELRIKGLYIHGRANAEPSRVLSGLECDVILLNETDPQKITVPRDYVLFRMRDLQEFPYLALVKVHKGGV